MSELAYLDLTITDEAKLAAQAIDRISGAATVAVLQDQINTRLELIAIVEGGAATEEPLCPELTNANPASPHTVITEALAWAEAQLAHRINQLPEQNHIAVARILGVEPREATAAVTTLRFTVNAPTEGTVVPIPIGTEVTDDSGQWVFQTTAAAQRTGDGTVDVLAERTTAGRTLLSPGVLTHLVSVPAYVTAVTNPSGVESGSEAESRAMTLERARAYHRRGERLVTAEDIRDAIYYDGLLSNGIVRVFPFIENGDYSGTLKAGYGTVVVMTRTGDTVDATTQARVAALLDQVVGNQFWYLANPEFVEFTVRGRVKLLGGTLQSSVLASVTKNLQDFYAATREQFGRGIYRSEIVAVIEGTPGVDRIVLQADGLLLENPTEDTEIEAHQLAKLIEVDIEVVN